MMSTYRRVSYEKPYTAMNYSRTGYRVWSLGMTDPYRCAQLSPTLYQRSVNIWYVKGSQNEHAKETVKRLRKTAFDI